MDVETLKAVTQFITPIFLFGLGVVSAVIGWFLRDLRRSIKDQFVRVNAKMDKLASTAEEKPDRIERDLNQLKADLPRDFVLRDDYIRVTTIQEAKLDKIINRLGVA